MKWQEFLRMMIKTNLGLLLLVGCTMPPATPIKTAQGPDQAYWPTQDWQTSSPEQQGFDSAKLAEGLQHFKDRNTPIDSLLIIRNGYVVLDAYFYPYDNSVPHKLASVTKSVMTTLIGIAVDQGKIELDQPMLSFFPERDIANPDAQKERITVRHLVSMMNGFESGCLTGDESTLDAMRSQADWVQAALDRKMMEEPGTSFCYDSPGMQLLSAILQNVTGMPALDFARQTLFEPLGIREVVWQADPQGYTRGWGDLFLKPREAAKIGYLWLNQGQWEGKQIVSASWVADSVKAHSNAGGDDYGYGWWVARSKAPDDSYFAVGRGGQFIRVYPSYNAIVVITAHGLGDYEQISPMLSASFVSPNEALAANPEGEAQLNATLTSLGQSPQAWPIGPLPELAKKISGKTMVFKSNPADVETLRLEFSDANAATLYITKLQGDDETWSMSLDGKYQLLPDGRAVRGYWADPQTFVIEVFEDGQNTYRLGFANDRVNVSSPELGLSFAGQIENP